ncbi:MAG: hypothetical protein M3Q31_05800 [Actinomycetota bacterium]|nr:hypothetical protein [Actinomycetota bacterium]
MSARFALSLAVTALVVAGVGLVWNHSRARHDDGHARILLLDPRTGTTLHEHSVPADYAIAELLAGDRVAVASENGCPDSRGARITVLDASLQHVISERSVNPCMVARLNVGDLRKRFGQSSGTLPDYNGGHDVTVRLGAGKIVETYAHPNGLFWLTEMTAYDASGRVLWKRGSLGRIGVVDVRNGRVMVPVFGEFALGSD